MMEAFMSSDIWQAILAAAPAVGSIIGMIVVALTSIKQVLTAINQFKSSSKLKSYVKYLDSFHFCSWKTNSNRSTNKHPNQSKSWLNFFNSWLKSNQVYQELKANLNLFVPTLKLFKSMNAKLIQKI